MRNFYILTEALEYIEQNICENINSQMIADYCCVSLSSLQKLFRIGLHLSIKEYIEKRRMCLAARDILHSNKKLIDIAYQYQFSSPESFTRAFTRIWNETPSSYRKHWKFSGLFPRINYDYKEGGRIMASKNVDISEAYETFRSMSNSYVICFDIIKMMAINNISHEAGDLAIIEVCKRIDAVSSDQMLLFRFGGDEFALVTGLDDLEETQKIAQQILSKNEEPIYWQDQKIPVSVRAGYTRIPEKSLYKGDFFIELHNTVHKIKTN
ncbi:MAG: helix-turn-helix domain-containing protein [Lachnospiraceae bacterium]|nr:helix-turn-helix domain-containing protein [Lachnospiraceae bacterium]